MVPVLDPGCSFVVTRMVEVMRVTRKAGPSKASASLAGMSSCSGSLMSSLSAPRQPLPEGAQAAHMQRPHSRAVCSRPGPRPGQHPLPDTGVSEPRSTQPLSQSGEARTHWLKSGSTWSLAWPWHCPACPAQPPLRQRSAADRRGALVPLAVSLHEGQWEPHPPPPQAGWASPTAVRALTQQSCSGRGSQSLSDASLKPGALPAPPTPTACGPLLKVGVALVRAQSQLNEPRRADASALEGPLGPAWSPFAISYRSVSLGSFPFLCFKIIFKRAASSLISGFSLVLRSCSWFQAILFASRYLSCSSSPPCPAPAPTHFRGPLLSTTQKNLLGGYPGGHAPSPLSGLWARVDRGPRIHRGDPRSRGSIRRL